MASDDTNSLILVTGTTPQIRLNSNVADSSDDDRAIFGLATANDHFVTGAVSGDAVLRTTNGGNLIFGEGTTERFRITSTGAVGIGTNNPAQKLHIMGDGNPIILLEDGSGTDQTFTRYKSSAHNWSVGADHQDGSFVINKSTNLRTGTPELYISSAGNVGIGTDNPIGVVEIYQNYDNSSDYWLNSGQTLRIKNAHSSGYASLRLLGGGSGGDNNAIVWGGNGHESIIFANRQNERLRITDTGLVRVPDNGKFVAGNGDDLQIYHDGSNSWISDEGTGNKFKKY